MYRAEGMSISSVFVVHILFFHLGRFHIVLVLHHVGSKLVPLEPHAPHVAAAYPET